MRKNIGVIVFMIVLVGLLIVGGFTYVFFTSKADTEKVFRDLDNLHLDAIQHVFGKIYSENNKNFDWIMDGDNSVTSSLSAEYGDIFDKEFKVFLFRLRTKDVNRTASGKEVRIRKDSNGVVVYLENFEEDGFLRNITKRMKRKNAE